MKQRFFSSSLGAWVTTATPSSTVRGVRPPAEDHRQGLLRAHAAELLAAVDVEEEVGVGSWERDLGDRPVGREALLPVVAVDDSGPGAARREPQEGHGVVRVDQLTGDDEDERRATGGDRGELPEAGRELAQRGERGGEGLRGPAREGGVAEVEEGLGREGGLVEGGRRDGLGAGGGPPVAGGVAGVNAVPDDAVPAETPQTMRRRTGTRTSIAVRRNEPTMTSRFWTTMPGIVGSP